MLSLSYSSSISPSSSLMELSQNREQPRNRNGSLSVSFNETVQIRNHLHVMDITPEERIAAWFQEAEYQTIREINSKIIRRIRKLNKKKKKTNDKETKKIKKWTEKKGSGVMHEYLQQKQLLFQEQQRHRNDNNDETYFEREEELCCEQKGYSIRGFEKRTSSARKISNDIYFEAKLIVLSIHSEYADTISQKYKQVCQQCTIDARERGVCDEKIARRIHQQSRDYRIDLEDFVYCNKERRQSHASTTSTSTAITMECYDFDDYDIDDSRNNNCYHSSDQRNNKTTTKQSSGRSKNLAKKLLRRLSPSSSSTITKKLK